MTGASSPPKPASRWRARFILVVASIVVTLMACEIGARLIDYSQEQKALRAWQQLSEQRFKAPAGSDASLLQIIRLAKNPRIVYEHIPSQQFRFNGADCRINRHGFRGPEIDIDKPADAYRVVVLGDSVAFGHGVAETDCFASRLEGLLQQALPQKRVQVINTAVSGYNTAMEVATLEEKGLPFHPDLVVYHFIGNDLDLPNLIWTPQNYWTLRRSFLWQQVARAFTSRDPWTDRPFGVAPMQDNRFVYKDDEVAPQYRDMVGIEMFQRELRRLRDLSQQHGFRVIVSVHWNNPPYLAETCAMAGLPLVAVDSVVRQHMHEHGIADYYKSDLVLSPQDPHPGPLVHQWIAEAIVARLTADRMLPQ
jgi:hypothetical protein